jgi:uncharacterized membrane-anchored protein YitT (DUF2179 family)
VPQHSPKVDVNQWIGDTGHPVVTYTVRILILLIGCFIGAVGINSFLVPAHILAGGITGVSQIIHHFIPVPIGTLYFVFNIPLFILGYLYLGKKFIVFTGIGIVAFSAFTDWVHLGVPLPMEDPLLICLYGGVLLGISSGLIFRIGGSAGGTDILSLVINRVTGRSVGSLGFGMNILIVMFSMTVFGVDLGMYTLVSMFATSRVINALLHYQNRKTAVIVSSRSAEIGKAIGEKLIRGSTLLAGSGAYTNAQTGVLICVLTHLELSELKTLCTDIDPNVFITVLDTTEVVGKFRHLPM